MGHNGDEDLVELDHLFESELLRLLLWSFLVSAVVESTPVPFSELFSVHEPLVLSRNRRGFCLRFRPLIGYTFPILLEFLLLCWVEIERVEVRLTST